MSEEQPPPLQEQQPQGDLLIPMDEYLAAGVHIGTQQKNRDMEEYIYRARTDGLYVMDVQKTDEKIRVAGNFVADYEPGKVLIVSARQYGKKPIGQFAQVTGIIAKPEQSPVYLRVKRLYPAVHHLGKARHRFDPDYIYARFAERLRRSARADNLYTHSAELLCEFNRAALVRNADQRRLDFYIHFKQCSFRKTVIAALRRSYLTGCKQAIRPRSSEI